MFKKIVTVLMVAVMILGCLGGTAFAAQDIGDEVQKHAQAGGDAIKNEIDTLVGNIVSFVRGVAGIFAVVFVIWAGFIFFGAGGDPRKIAYAKSMLAGFIVCIIFIYSAEKIVGGILGLLGYGG